MAQDIVAGLFGLSPYEEQQKQQAALDTQAQNFAAMDPLKIPAYLAGRVGQGLGGMLAESQGMVNPAVAQAQQRQQALQGLDLSSSQSILAKAATIQDPKMKFGLMQLADQVKQREITNMQHQAQTDELRRKTAAAELEAKRKQQLLDDPNTPEQIKNMLMAGNSTADIYKTHTVGKDQELGYIDAKTGEWKSIAKGKETEKDKWSEPYQLGGAMVTRNLTTGKVEQVVSRPPQVHVSGQSGGELTADMADVAIDMAKAGDNSMMIGWGRSPKAKAQLMARLSERVKSGELSPRDFAEAKISMSGALAGERTVASQGANIQLSANEANQMMDVVRSTIPAVNLTEYPSLNKLKNAVDKGLGGPAVPRLFASLNALVNTYARAINPRGVATVRDKEHATQMINEAMSAGQLEGVMQIMKSEMDAALAAPQQVRRSLANERSGGAVTHSVAPVNLGNAASAIPTGVQPSSRASQFTVVRD